MLSLCWEHKPSMSLPGIRMSIYTGCLTLLPVTSHVTRYHLCSWCLTRLWSDRGKTLRQQSYVHDLLATIEQKDDVVLMVILAPAKCMVYPTIFSLQKQIPNVWLHWHQLVITFNDRVSCRTIWFVFSTFSTSNNFHSRLAHTTILY